MKNKVEVYAAIDAQLQSLGRPSKLVPGGNATAAIYARKRIDQAAATCKETNFASSATPRDHCKRHGSNHFTTARRGRTPVR